MKRLFLLTGIVLFLIPYSFTQDEKPMNFASNKELVLHFYKEVIGNRRLELLDEIVHEDYIQHSPNVKDGREGLREALEFLKQMPEPKEKKSPILRTVAEGNLVMLHLYVEFMGKKLVIMEIFRVEDQKIMEHWSVEQEVPEKMAHNNGMR